MTHSEKNNKLSKYCYKMNKACGEKDIPKLSNYFNHFKYHIMTGGTINNEINTLIGSIQTGIDKINNEKNTYKSELDRLSNKLKELMVKQEELVNKNNECEKDLKLSVEKVIELVYKKQQLMNEQDGLEEENLNLKKGSKSWFT